jgi:RNA polymerase-binding protein DksA
MALEAKMTLRVLRQAQIEALKRALAGRHAELLEETREDVGRARDETYAELAGPVTDAGDRASADVLADLGNAEVSRDVREVEALEAALARINDGTYGSCATCGSEIGFDRLRAYPTATRCTPCQIRHERTHAHPGEPRL